MLYKRLNKIKNDGGFTLIEVIVSLLVAAVLAAILVQFMGTSLVKSYNPVILAQNGTYLNSIMENMTADYKYYMFYGALNGQSPATAYASFNTRVGTSSESEAKTLYSDAQHPYYVVANNTITFSGSGSSLTEASASSKVHKITIKYRDLTVTSLFTE
jgi:prepilin-type N-terminal cleavage/methylation domain-containing protein